MSWRGGLKWAGKVGRLRMRLRGRKLENQWSWG